MVAWQDAQPVKVSSLVFLLAAVVTIIFTSYACGTPGYTGVLQVTVGFCVVCV
jgi:hypothetical protein